MSSLRRLRLLTTSGRPLRTATFALTVAAFSLRSAAAFAGDEAAAEALFLEGKRLAAEGKLAEACPKFAESNRLDRGAGTLIHLADCYEKNHQSASAWATFKEAASAAQGLGRADWEKLANTRAAALEPKLARLTIRVREPADKIEVTRDGAPTSPASWNVPIPVDIGTHAVQASAPGRRPFKTTIAINKDGDRDEVVVPKLEPQAAAVAAPSTTPADADAHGGSQRTIGYVIGGIGLAGLGAGAITGLVAIGKNNDSKKACPDNGACASNDAVSANDSARTFGTISTIAFIGGGVAVALGAALVLTSGPSTPERTAGTPKGPKDAARRSASASAGVRIVPDTDGRSAGMTVMGSF